MTTRLLANFEDLKAKRSYGMPIDFNIAPKNCVVSLTEENLHMPMLDDDAGIFEVVASRTNGHKHVFINKSLTWDQAKKLLEVLQELELVDTTWAQYSIDQEVMTIRL